jgi:hypothetical protein
VEERRKAESRRWDVIESELSAQEKLLLLILLESHMMHPPSERALALYLGVGERRIRQLIAALRRKRHLQTFRHHRENRYIVQSRKSRLKVTGATRTELSR